MSSLDDANRKKPELSHFTGQIMGDHTMRILGADAAPAGPLTVAANADTPPQFLVTLRNLDNGEQSMHAHPIDTLNAWQELFVDSPLLKGVNLLRERRFPSLSAPSEIRPWTAARFTKGNMSFIVVASLVPPAPLPTPGPHVDCVILFVRSPSLPTNHAALVSMAAFSSIKRRAIATHYAAAALATASGFTPSAAVHVDATAHAVCDPALVYGDELLASNTIELRCAFVSNLLEASAGSIIIPTALRHCSFLMPTLDDAAQGVVYDIVQPHRYGYAFRIRSVGGWQLLGAVNTGALSSDTLSDLFNDADAPEGAMAPTSLSTPSAYNAATLFRGIVNRAKTQTLRRFETAFQEWHASAPEVASFFGKAGHPDQPDIRARTSDAQKKRMPDDLWQAFIAYNGLERLENASQQSLVRAVVATEVQRGDRFIQQWLVSVRLGAMVPQTGTAIVVLSAMDLANVLYEACCGLAKAVVAQHEEMHRNALAPTALKRTLRDHRHDLPVIEISQAIDFFRSARGVPPTEWAARAASQLLPDPLAFANVLLTEPMLYANLLLPITDATMDRDPIKVKAFLSRAKVHSVAIQQGAAASAWCATRERDRAAQGTQKKKRQMLVHGLAYEVFANAPQTWY